jgi:hypothetical protein
MESRLKINKVSIQYDDNLLLLSKNYFICLFNGFLSYTDFKFVDERMIMNDQAGK